MIAYLNLSGGVDSTYYAWRWLKENPKNRILLHHCLYMKARLKEEGEACKRIIEYFRTHGLGNYKYVTTTLDKGTLSGIVYDVEVLSGLTGIILKLYPKITNVLLSYSREETSDLNLHIKMGRPMSEFNPKHRYSIANKVVEVLSKRQFNYVFYKDKDGGLISKAQMMAEMPQELFEMTWYCRSPRQGKPCGSCHTCKKVAAGKKKNYERI